MLQLLIVCVSACFFVSCAPKQEPTDLLPEPLTTVDVQVLPHLFPEGVDSLITFVFGAECDGVVGLYLRKGDKKWEVAIERIPKPVWDTTAHHRALFEMSLDWKEVPDSLGGEIFQKAKLLGPEFAIKKSRREDLEVYPMVCVYAPDVIERRVKRKIFRSISKSSASENLLQLRLLLPKLFDAFYGECADTFPGCLIYAEMHRAIKTGGALYFGCLSNWKKPEP